MDPSIYRLRDEDEIISPALIYYKDLLLENVDRTIALAGDTERLWPHLKSHKSADFLKVLMEKGIRKFKCATIAEAEMAADVGAEKLILAYPLIGPNIRRFGELVLRFPGTEFFAIADDAGQMQLLHEEAVAKGILVNLLIDINTGLDRTGIRPEKAMELFHLSDSLSGIRICGMHVYDGHRHESAPEDRNARTREDMKEVLKLKTEAEAAGYDCSLMVMGGTPSFPCHQPEEGAFLSPGTCLIQDYGYASGFEDLEFPIAAMLLTRVVSHPAPGVFTLDLGCKAVATDPPIPRAVVAGYEDCETLMQNEEHLVLRMPKGREEERPAIGTCLYAAPWHICPTTALYPEILVAQKGVITDIWNVTARNRKITI
ncbi:MAG: D-TA family PLP-dependent enzyme [Lachnospiraceae bacterium]|nr:D-TA family PLP-dependent enzyme [Lachnospiraceae bacterium]